MKFSFFTSVFLLIFLVFSTGSQLFAQRYQVSGQVISAEDGMVLPGANVVLKETGKGAITDADGKFRLNQVREGGYTLTISFIGYEKVERPIEVSGDVQLDISLQESVITGDEVIVFAMRNYPITKTEVTKKELEAMNLGQDLPIMLNFTPSIVTTSDAGAGIGYTGMRIRGSDPQRINVTLNGIPLNDSESHGVFWVNMPDFATSVENITIQRGVGTSVNGAGAFGASVNINTAQPEEKAFAETSNSFGSFNSWRHNVQFGTGLINDKFNVTGRLSKITSDGFIDRSGADLRSFFVSGSYQGEKSSLVLNVFSGRERTQQAWWGTPEVKLNNDLEGMQDYIVNNGLTAAQADNLLNSDRRRFNYYIHDNETDNYQQDHYQLLYNWQLGNRWRLNTALHYTRGRGYFEQYRYNRRLTDYDLEPVEIGGETIERSDVVLERWLDNHFYGAVYSFNYQSEKKLAGSPLLDVVIGGGWNQYLGDHYGDVAWANFMVNRELRHQYYFNDATKNDLNLYAKASYQVAKGLFVFGDLQVRDISYEIEGIDNDRRDVTTDDHLTFFNPKAGARYFFGQNEVYASLAMASKEPNRRDYTDNTSDELPRPETLRNLEVGYSKNMGNTALAVNYYLMDYKDQLVPTGEVNDVGGAIRTNIPRSYRMGVELQWRWELSNKIIWDANATFSRNRNRNYTEFIINYDDFGYIQNELGDTHIALSPEIIAGSQFMFKPIANLELALLSKYVGDQYLDNSSNDNRKIDAYFTNDFRLAYAIPTRAFEKINVNLLVNNIFNVEYASNGYTYAYQAGGSVIRDNHFYPQAGTNFLLGLTVRI